MLAVEVNHVVKSFTDKVAVDDLSFSVAQGELFGLIGPNGAGKTTTIRMMMDIIKPDSGEVTILGEKLSEATKNKLGYLPEEHLGKPVIAILNTWSDINPCHVHLRDRAQAVKRGVWQAGGFPLGSLTEDFELSIHLHEQGWRTAYVPDVLTQGLGPEDMAGYVSQQQRWARGCLSGVKTALKADLPLHLRAQYLLSSMFFLTGWTVLIYMSMPIIRILTGAQPLATAGADQFLAHFAPYFGFALYMVALLGGGAYTFRAFALQSASFWIHIQASLRTLFRRPGRFVVTPKQGALVRQPRAVLPALFAIAALVVVAVYGLSRDRSPAMWAEFAEEGLVFDKNGGRYVAPLSRVQRALGSQVADRVLLYAGQVADFLGVSSPPASKLVKRHGLALSQGLAKAPWGLVQRIRRVGRKRFCVPGS